MSKIGPSKDAVPCSSRRSTHPSGSLSLNTSGGKRGFSNERTRGSQKEKLIYVKRQPVEDNLNTASKFDKEHLSQAHGVEEVMHSCPDTGSQPVQSDSGDVQNSNYEQDFPPLSAENLGRSKTRIDLGLERGKEAITFSKQKGLNEANSARPCEENSLPTEFRKKVAYRENSYSAEFKSRSSGGTKNPDYLEDSVETEIFFICNRKSRNFDRQIVSMNQKYFLGGFKMDQSVNGSEHTVLRPGMVLLKHFISLTDQIQIVKMCNYHGGKRPGGFYRPGYKGGAKLRLHMMCLGLNWDPQTRKYHKEHPVDHCKPPDIPRYFSLLVQRAIKEAHTLIEKDLSEGSVEDVLPTMSPDICIVNFYTNSGRLGLHQDRDETWESIEKGLPVVSFSIGDSAEFLYGDERDANKAESVLLESGDVLIFGGESRLVFHGVPSIIPNTAPEPLLAKTGLRSGRLNLTFRKF